MAYTPINWATGDTITADKLNRCDNGWAVESSSQQLFTETVTTVDDGGLAWGDFAYSTQITVDTATVTFDGTDYVCSMLVDPDGANVYGGYGEESPDFTDYPFTIFSEPGSNYICTPTGGTHTVSVAGTSSSIETSPAFETAVSSVVDTSTMPMLCVSGTTTLAEMGEAYGAGRILFFRPRVGVSQIRYITDFTSSSVTFIPSDPSVTATFDNGVFTVNISV